MISLIEKEIEELHVRIHNRQNAIHWATSVVHDFDALEGQLDDLREAVKGYEIAFGVLKEKREHLRRLEEDV